MKNYLLVITLFLITKSAFALPSLDPRFHTEVVVNGYSFKLIQDTDQVGKWYYIPPRLRVVERDNHPDIRLIVYVADGRENAIVQCSVTAAASEAELRQVQTHLQDWYKKQNQTLPPLSLSLIGPLRSSTFRMLSLQASGDSFTLKPLWDPVAASSPTTVSLTRASQLAVAGKVNPDPTAPDEGTAGRVVEEGTVNLPNNQTMSVEPASPELTGRGLTIPGGHLNQNVVLQFEVTGTVGTQVYETLLKGKSGGLALIWVGEYDAMSVPAKVEIELDVRGAQTYFREYTKNQSKKRFLFWGSNKTEIRDFLRTSNFLDRSLKVKIDGNPEVLNDDKLDHISGQLMTWVTHQCFNVKQVPATSKDALAAPGAPNTEIDLGNFSTLFGLPPLKGLGLNIGFSSSSVHYVADYRSDIRQTAKASWEQRTVVREPIAIAGNVSLGQYENPDQYVERVEITPLPKVIFRLPAFEDVERSKIIDGAVVSLENQLRSGRSGQWSWQFSKNRIWKYIGDPAETGVNENDREREFPNCPRIALNRDETTDGASAVFVANRVNAHLNFAPAEIDRFSIARSPENGTNLVDFAGERFPLRLMELDPSFFPFGEGDGAVKSVKVSFGVESENGVDINRSLSTDPVVLPTFDATRREPLTFLYPGQVTGVAVDVTYVDLFDRREGTHQWVASRITDDSTPQSSVLTRIASGAASWIIQPEDIGIRTYQINVSTLFRQFNNPALITLSLTGSSESNPVFSRQWGEDSKEEVLHFVSQQQVKSVAVKIDTDDGVKQFLLSEERLADLNGSVGVFRVVKTMLEPTAE